MINRGAPAAVPFVLPRSSEASRGNIAERLRSHLFSRRTGLSATEGVIGACRRMQDERDIGVKQALVMLCCRFRAVVSNMVTDFDGPAGWNEEMCLSLTGLFVPLYIVGNLACHHGYDRVMRVFGTDR